LTIEGVAKNGVLSPVQREFIEHGALQCGFCTPAVVLAGEALLRHKPSPTRQDIVEAIEGILCRCTGYRQIVDAVLDASKRKPLMRQDTGRLRDEGQRNLTRKEIGFGRLLSGCLRIGLQHLGEHVFVLFFQFGRPLPRNLDNIDALSFQCVVEDLQSDVDHPQLRGEQFQYLLHQTAPC
jgi:hypothetical protein